MARKQVLLRFMIFIACIPFVGLLMTRQEADWLYYLSLAAILLGTGYIQYLNWRNGKKEQVKKRLITYAVIVGASLVVFLVIGK